MVAIGCSPDRSNDGTDQGPRSTTHSNRQQTGQRQSQPTHTAAANDRAEQDSNTHPTEPSARVQIFSKDQQRILQSSTPVSSGEKLRSEVDVVTAHLTNVLPETPDILEIRARFLNLIGDLDAAETTWMRATQIDPNYGYAHHGLGKIAKLKGNFEQAIKYFRKSEKTQPDNAELIQDLANVLITTGDSGEAVKTLDDFMKRNGESPDILLLHGNASLAEQNFEQAKSSFSRVLQLHPNAARAQDGLISALVRLGQRQEARNLMAEKRKKDQAQATANTSTDGNSPRSLSDELKDCSQIYFQACIVLSNLGYLEDAELLAQRATIFDPNNLQCWRLLIEFAQASSNEKMLQTCQAMTLANPDDPSVHFEYGSLLLSAGDSQAAKSKFEKVIELSPQDPAGYAGVLRASIQARTDLEQALEIAHKLVQLAPSAQHHDLLAQTYALTGDFEKARQEIKIAIEKDPQNKQLLFAKEQLEKLLAK